jgi:isopenicillin-N N-acyltransferase-like protein
VFAETAGWSWPQVCEQARRFVEPMERFEPRFVEEMRGIAAGAGLEDIDIFAMNVRAEVMFSASARDARSNGHAALMTDGCTSFALMGERAIDGRMLIGQTWDWLGYALDTVILLEAHQDEGPDFVSVVEAGLLAKLGMNSAGIGVCTNGMVCAWDTGEPGVPLHLLLRAILDSEAVPYAVSALARGRRASSGNYLIADQDGLAIDVEAAPGGYERLYIGYPERGLILHANHFTSRRFDGHDVAPYAMPDSPFRLQRLRQLIEPVPRLDRESFQSAFADHATFPFGICCHPNTQTKESQRWETVAAAIMDIEARKLWLASGNPCTNPFECVDLSDALSKPSPLRDRAPVQILG